MTRAVDNRRLLGPDGLLNTKYHKAALLVFGFVVVAHWVEHLSQAYQIYVLDWARPKAGGALGLAFPWLVRSEWLHYGFAIFMLVAFVVLRHGFRAGPGRGGTRRCGSRCGITSSTCFCCCRRSPGRI